MVVALSTPHRKEHTTMKRRATLKYTLTAALATSVLAASPAVAKPVDAPVNRADSPTGSLAGTTSYTPGSETPVGQDLRNEFSKDAAIQAAKDEKLMPGQPVFPGYHEPLPPRALNISAPATNDDGSDVGIWLLLLSGLAGAGIAGGGAAGLVRHSRLRARRVAA
jgi:hypothetical protein